ncbi:MAG: hypothetical protein ACKOWW_08580 [Flavobacteriales bacterium]
MKDQFENNIKSLVEDFTYDYDPKAWEALSKKLPTSPKAGSVIGKIAALVVVITVAAALWFNTNPTQNQTSTVQEQKITRGKESVFNEQKTKSRPQHNASKELAIQNVQNNALFQASGFAATATEQITNQSTRWATAPLEITSLSDAPTQRPDVGTWTAPELLSEKPKLPEPATEFQNKPTAPCQGLKVQLTAENISYESGYPMVHINAESSVSNITWSSNGSLINQKSKATDLLAFKQQTYTVSAHVSQEECNTTESLTIISDQNYNLLAVNAFNPQSRDERNARFMPYALTIREVRFVLTIIDPDNGAVIFNTADAQNAWDGIDQRTGQLIKAQKAYIWRVLLENPLPGEKNTYTGTIVRI